MKKTPIVLLTVLFIIGQTIHVSCTNPTKNAGTPQEKKEDTAWLTTAPGETTGKSPDLETNEPTNFVKAARVVTPAVVHIRTSYNAVPGSQGGMGEATGRGSASGVIITSNGYIATNNHVVENASAIDVILTDKREFRAELIGRDPNTDLALIKIKADSLPFATLGNSDSLQIGEWVLAIGYPLSLNTTVTAGIVSAKARSIGIINRPTENQAQGSNTPQAGNTAVESFIQTDAAINPGNSGGALVNTSGELIGINSAIASQTGSYAGYAFAIPVNLAKKILGDLKNYGVVKRGVLGVSFPAPAAEDQYLVQQGLDPGKVKGVYITGVQNQSAAAAAGLEEGDVIQRIDGLTLTSSSEFSERIARHKPGDKIKLTYMRNGKVDTTSATLKGEQPEKNLAENNQSLDKIYDRLGASFAPLTAIQKQRLNVNSGVVVTSVRSGGFFDQIGIPRGTIIAFVNGRPVNMPKDVSAALLSAQNGMVQMLAIAPDGSKVAFNFSLGT